jgi:hypothetical protein
MEIGQMIQWKVDGKLMLGIFMQYIGGKAEVMCFSMGGVRCGIRTLVSPDLLTLLAD